MELPQTSGFYWLRLTFTMFASQGDSWTPAWLDKSTDWWYVPGSDHAVAAENIKEIGPKLELDVQ